MIVIQAEVNSRLPDSNTPETSANSTLLQSTELAMVAFAVKDFPVSIRLVLFIVPIDLENHTIVKNKVLGLNHPSLFLLRQSTVRLDLLLGYASQPNAFLMVYRALIDLFLCLRSFLVQDQFFHLTHASVSLVSCVCPI